MAYRENFHRSKYLYFENMLGSKWFKEIGDLAKYGLDLEFENMLGNKW